MVTKSTSTFEDMDARASCETTEAIEGHDLPTPPLQQITVVHPPTGSGVSHKVAPCSFDSGSVFEDVRSRADQDQERETEKIQQAADFRKESKTALTNEPTSSFGRLPAELRLKVYRDALVVPAGLSFREVATDSENAAFALEDKSTLLRTHAFSLLFVNRQTHTEALEVLYAENKFSFSCPCTLTMFLMDCEAGVKLVRHITLRGYLKNFVCSPIEEYLFLALNSAQRLCRLHVAGSSLSVHTPSWAAYRILDHGGSWLRGMAALKGAEAAIRLITFEEGLMEYFTEGGGGFQLRQWDVDDYEEFVECLRDFLRDD